MAHKGSRLPLRWEGKQYKSFDEPDCTGKNGRWQCPECNSQAKYKDVVEVKRSGMFEDHYNTLVVCSSCGFNIAIHSVVRNKKHVAI